MEMITAPAITEPIVTIEQMLVARDRRAAREAAALARFDLPLLSMNVVTPGPVKDGWLPRRVLEAAVEEVEVLCTAGHWRVRWRHVAWPDTGPEALYVVDVDAELLKAATIHLEDEHPLGRLWDLDVIAPRHGRLSRQALGRRERRCPVCEEPADACRRARQHPAEELVTAYGLHSRA
jgi:holo-ACP synthase